jgi:hypothetical protein
MKAWKGRLRQAQIRFLRVAKQTGNAVAETFIGAHVLLNTTCPGKLRITHLIYSGSPLAANSFVRARRPQIFQQHVTSVHVISSWNRRKLLPRTL